MELCEWIETRTSDNANPFKGANISTTANATTYDSKFTDIMYHIKEVGKRNKIHGSIAVFLYFYIYLSVIIKSSKNVDFILNLGTFRFADYNYFFYNHLNL